MMRDERRGTPWIAMLKPDDKIMRQNKAKNKANGVKCANGPRPRIIDTRDK